MFTTSLSHPVHARKVWPSPHIRQQRIATRRRRIRRLAAVYLTGLGCWIGLNVGLIAVRWCVGTWGTARVVLTLVALLAAAVLLQVPESPR